MVTLPPILFFYRPAPFYNFIMPVLLLVVIIFIFRTSSLIHGFTKRHEAVLDKFSKKYKLLLRKRMNMKISGQNKK